MSRRHQQIAKNLTVAQRRVLCALEYFHRMSADHIATQMRLNAARDGSSSYGIRWPSASLRALEERGLVGDEWYMNDDRTKGETFYRLTETGSKVARYCYSNGGIADAS